jgi:hypothetical protein
LSSTNFVGNAIHSHALNEFRERPKAFTGTRSFISTRFPTPVCSDMNL